MKARKFLFILPLALCLLSCDKWLEHSPYDKLEGDKLYSTEEGVQEALNGLYINLLNTSAYTGSMMIVPDIMAQMYYMPTEHGYYYYRIYDWTDSGVKSRVLSMWRQMYSCIAQCNVFLREIEERKDIYDQNNYLLYRGEALALRTFLHFDLFRLWGPRNSRDMNTMENDYIPYYDKDSDIPTPYLTGVEFMENLMADIDEAIGLLDGDPILKYGLRNGAAATEDFWDYRNFRMNYYAVWALKARMCLHFGDTDNAYLISTALLNGRDPGNGSATNFWKMETTGSGTFTPVINQPTNYRDPVFFTEMLFGMHNVRRLEMHKRYFTTDLEDNSIFAASENYLSGLYMEGDLRSSHWMSYASGSSALRALVKFQDSGVQSGYEPYKYQIQSLIRLGEVYLIAAESSDTEDEKRDWLRQLRIYRGMDNTNAVGYDIETLLTTENIREMYGEGQLLYYYKRNGMTTIRSNSASSGTVDVTSSNFRLLIPASEDDNRVN